MKDQVLDQLPDKVECVLRCSLSGWQKHIYNSVQVCMNMHMFICTYTAHYLLLTLLLHIRRTKASALEILETIQGLIMP